ncbi:ParA family protein [uncultured Bacteroides sp.]|uniref:ParA family protein n=1 Tax=uncultured Bacteroides sp. TaxID=162156 RepID=UPI00259A1BE6|nr:ParA family protein [uncultured Bacteroides sp.]
MTKVIAVLNYKGGVGKSTTTYNLGVALWILGKKVLLIDTDAQCNLSGLIGFDQTAGDSTFYEWMKDDDVNMPIYALYDGLSYVPASKALSTLEGALIGKRNRERILSKKLSAYLQPNEDGNYIFDYILIDCAPKDGVVNDNAMSASDYVLIPTECSGFSLQGMQNLLFSIQDIHDNINDKLDILGFLMVKYDRQTRISKQVTEYFSDHFSDKMFKTRIRKNIKFDESPLVNQGIFEYAPESNGAEDYMSLAEEITGAKRPSDWRDRAVKAWEENQAEESNEIKEDE